jgi:hypothetical protein
MLLAQAALYAPESSATVMVAGPAVKEGASFTATASSVGWSCQALGYSNTAAATLTGWQEYERQLANPPAAAAAAKTPTF